MGKTRSEVLTVRMTPEERRLVERLAAVMGAESLSDWLRTRLYELALAGWFAGEPVGVGDAEGLDTETIAGVLQSPGWLVDSVVRFGLPPDRLERGRVAGFTDDVRRMMMQAATASDALTVLERVTAGLSEVSGEE